MEIESNIKPPKPKGKSAAERARDRVFMAYRRQYARIYIAEPTHYTYDAERNLMTVYVGGQALPGASPRRLMFLTGQLKDRAV